MVKQDCPKAGEERMQCHRRCIPCHWASHGDRMALSKAVPVHGTRNSEQRELRATRAEQSQWDNRVSC